MGRLEVIAAVVSAAGWRCGLTVRKIETVRADSRWKAELLNLYRSAESLRAEIPDPENGEYQTGVMMACLAIWHRVTGESLV